MISEEQRKYAVQLYELSGNSNKRAVEMFMEKFGVTISTRSLRDYWDDAGFKRNSHGGQRSGMSEEKFMELYNKHDGDISKMIDESGYHVSGLIKRCDKAGLSHKNNPKKQERNDTSFLVEPDIIRAGRNGDFF